MDPALEFCIVATTLGESPSVNKFSLSRTRPKGLGPSVIDEEFASPFAAVGPCATGASVGRPMVGRRSLIPGWSALVTPGSLWDPGIVFSPLLEGPVVEEGTHAAVPPVTRVPRRLDLVYLRLRRRKMQDISSLFLKRRGRLRESRLLFEVPATVRDVETSCCTCSVPWTAGPSSS